MKPLLSLSLVAVLWVAASPAQDTPATMISVKYDGLKQEVLKHRGKVLLIDFWASD
jgi:hypothetical protein